MYNEENLAFMQRFIQNNPSATIGDYNMDKLELEYDYETDEE